MNEQQGYRMGVGASSVLMIFVVLCLTTLGVLSFASARIDNSLTARRKAQVESYYAATAEGQRVLAQIDKKLVEARRSPETFDTSVMAMEIPGAQLDISEDMIISYRVPVSASQELQIAISVNEPDQAERYSLLHHRLVNIADWEPEGMESFFWDF